MSTLSNLIPGQTALGAAALLPGNRFFVRSVALEGEDATGQVALALEALSPFPTEQMLVGHVVSTDGKQALAYAAHRRRFTPEESFAWPDDCQVIPEFLALCAERPAGAGVLVHRGAERLIALAWDATNPLPVAISVADLADADEASLGAEVAGRAGLTDAPVTTVTGALRSELNEGDLVLQREGGKPFTVTKKGLDEADIRDVDFLEARRKKERVNLLLWNLTRAAVAVLILSLVLEVAAAGIQWRSGQLQALNESREPDVLEIEADQATASRIEEVRTKSPLALEMLAIANEQRPATVEFTRINCKVNTTLEIEARTTNPSDISAFERALKEFPEVSAVASKDMRARDNYTTFTFTITFKVDTLRKSVAKAEAEKVAAEAAAEAAKAAEAPKALVAPAVTATVTPITPAVVTPATPSTPAPTTPVAPTTTPTAK
jgi:hypothetical protein